MKSQKFTVLALTGICCFWSAVSAADVVVEYQVSNANFDDGGSVSGTFTYDFTTEAYTSVALVTTATTNQSGNAPVNGPPGFLFPGATYTNPIPASAANINGVDEVSTTPSTDRIDLVFTNPLTATGATLRISSFESQNGADFRDLVSGGIVSPVPLPPSLVLLLSGAGALLCFRRRNSTPGLATRIV